MWFFQFKWLPICKPRKVVLTGSHMCFPLQPVFNACCGKWFVVNFTTFVLRRFRAMLLAVNHFSREKNMFEIKQKSSTLLLETITLVSSSNVMDSQRFSRQHAETETDRHSINSATFRCEPLDKATDSIYLCHCRKRTRGSYCWFNSLKTKLV
jgi:hypothetical protein